MKNKKKSCICKSVLAPSYKKTRKETRKKKKEKKSKKLKKRS